MVDQTSRRGRKHRKNLTERCTHVIYDYIPLAKFWLAITVNIYYKTLIVPGGYQPAGHQTGRRDLYNTPMPHRTVQVILVLLLILLAVFAPLILSGYSELRAASAAASHAEAAQHYYNAAQRIPWRGDLYELAGHYYYYARAYKEADAAYQKALARNALSSEGWVAWGDVVYLADDPARAGEIWERARGLANPAAQLHSRLAEVYQSEGELSRAAEALESYVASYPDDADAHYRLGLLLTLSNLDRATAELLSAARLDPQFGPAVETLQAALSQSSHDGTTAGRFLTAGRGLGLVNEWELAQVAFEAAVDADEEHAEAWAWLGEAKQHAISPDSGLEELERAVVLDPRSAPVRGLRGLYFQRVGNFRQARIEFETAAALDPENPAWLVSMGEAYAKTGDLIRALQAYQTATTLAPEDPGYWRLLAIFCAQNNVNVRDIGIPAAQKAVVLAPEDPDSMDVLGWLLFSDARYEEAAGMLSRALELDPNHAAAHLHAGMLYLQTGNRALAHDYLLRARELGNKEAELVLQQYFQ